MGIIGSALRSGTVAGRLAEVIAPVPLIGEYSKSLSLAIVISLLSYLSLVIGEFVAKRLAMKFPETIASKMAGPMAGLATMASPVVSLLSWSTGSC